jgi:hypothetical protein
VAPTLKFGAETGWFSRRENGAMGEERGATWSGSEFC